METERLCYGGGVAPVAEAFNLTIQTVLVAEKSVHWLLFLIGLIANNADALSDLLEAEKRFPLSDLNKVASPDAECKDASETEDDSDDDDDDDEDAAVGEDSDNDAEDSSGEDNDDEEADPDSDSDANDDGEDDDDDDDDDDEDDDDDDEDDEEDEEEDEDEENQPPFKKKK